MSEAAKGSVRILLVEDNPVNQKLATIMLTKGGYKVEVAGNGTEGVEGSCHEGRAGEMHEPTILQSRSKES